MGASPPASPGKSTVEASLASGTSAAPLDSTWLPGPAVSLTLTSTQSQAYTGQQALFTAEVLDAQGYRKFFSARVLKCTVTLKQGTQLDYITVCFNDTHYPAAPAMPGSVSPAARRFR